MNAPMEKQAPEPSGGKFPFESALLEVIKLGRAAIIQNEIFGDVTIVARVTEGEETHATHSS